MDTLTGYIISREYRDNRAGHQLCLVGIGDFGPFEIRITRNRPLFFIPRTAPLPPLPFSCQRSPVELKNFAGEPVDVLYFSRQNQLYQARDILEKNGITTFEADVRPEERYLMERFIFGGIEFSGHSSHRPGRLPRFLNPVIRPRELAQPHFSTLSLDIETGQAGELYSIALDFVAREGQRWGQVFMVDPGGENQALEDGGTYLALASEKSVIQAFVKAVKDLDPDILLGWHVVGFDLAFLERKAQRLGITLSLGRDGGGIKIREARRGGFHASLYGRIIMDGPPALRNAFYGFENYRLETVARKLLNRGKKIGEAGDKVAEIERQFAQDKLSLAQYNLTDARLVTDIFEKTGLVELTFKRAVISGLPMDRVGYSVAAFEHYMLPQVHRRGLVAPNVKDLEDKGNSAGGLVFATEPGFYEQIVVFDFKSLYPSIIRTFHIDPLSRLRAQDEDKPLSTPMDIHFSREDHVLPDYIKALLERREQAKGEGDVHLSQAVKILMNSFYGVMGTMGCRFYHPDLSRAITGTGQWILRASRAHLISRGYGVLYGDTDSVFVKLKGGGDWDREARQLARETNAFLAEKVLEEFGVKSHLELEYEKRFSRFFLPAIRGGGNGAKKRYAGLVVRGGEEKLVFTGLEFVRSDWTRFAKDFQYELFHRIFHDQEVAQWIRTRVADLKAGKYDGDLIYKKRLRKPMAEYQKMVPPHVKAARILGPNPPREILYAMTLRGPIPVEHPHDDLDYHHYIQKQLKPIADAALLFLDTQFTHIMGGRQLDLFPSQDTKGKD